MGFSYRPKCKKQLKKKNSFIGKSFHDLKLGQDLTSCKKTLTIKEKRTETQPKNPPENSDYTVIKNFLLKNLKKKKTH